MGGKRSKLKHAKKQHSSRRQANLDERQAAQAVRTATTTSSKSPLPSKRARSGETGTKGKRRPAKASRVCNNSSCGSFGGQEQETNAASEDLAAPAHSLEAEDASTSADEHADENEARHCHEAQDSLRASGRHGLKASASLDIQAIQITG